jgi:hypothetical protein
MPINKVPQVPDARQKAAEQMKSTSGIFTYEVTVASAVS